MSRKLDISAWVFKLILIGRLKLQEHLWNYLVYFYCFLRGVETGKGNTFLGFPRISRSPNSRIIIGDNCTFNSSKISARMGLYKRCAFITLDPGSEIRIGDNSGAAGATIFACKEIVVGNNVLIGAYTTIVDSDFHNPDPEKRELENDTARPVHIQDNVFLGMNCVVLKGVTIGENSLIAANSVVISNIPPNSFAMGNPCKVVMKRNWGQDSKTENK